VKRYFQEFELLKCSYFMKYEVHRAVNMKITVFWDVLPSGVVESYQYFRETYCLDLPGKTVSCTVLCIVKQGYRYSEMWTTNIAAGSPMVDGGS
jgi:hypothetical protein